MKDKYLPFHSRSFFAIACALIQLVFVVGASNLFAAEISAQGEKLSVALDSMNVEKLWLAGRQVNWRTGEPNGKVYTNSSSHTHCSAFAAAAAEKLGVYLLRPPEHSSVLLANAQQDWLSHAGTNGGWYAVSTAKEAQKIADTGNLVGVTQKNPGSGKTGRLGPLR